MTDAARRVAVRKLQADADHRKSVALMKFLSGVARKEGVAKHVYVVGGAVRNYLLGVPIKDIDVVVDSVELGRGRDSEWFAKQVADAIPVPSSLVTNQYGVAILTVKGPWELEGLDLQGEVIEIANARKESYEGAGGKGKGYKPTDVAPATIKEDVFRREFTFNTLLWRLLDLVDGPEKAEVIDLTGLGRSHLEEKLISTPVNPDKTFSDDPTRQLRILKFLLRYGLKISPDVAASVKRNAHKLKQMPWEAVANILVRDILDSPRASEGLRVMRSLGMLDVLAEMVAETPPFAAYLNRQLASGNRPVALLLELADVGLSDKATDFLTSEQKSRFKAVAASLDPEEARKLLDALKRPPADNAAIIQEFALEGRDRGMLVTVARDVLLADPSALKNPVELNDRIRDRLRASLPARVASRHLAADNEPTNESLWEKCKETAKARYTKWPSAYAVGHALKLYREEGGGWKKKAGEDSPTLIDPSLVTGLRAWVKQTFAPKAHYESLSDLIAHVKTLHDKDLNRFWEYLFYNKGLLPRGAGFSRADDSVIEKMRQKVGKELKVARDVLDGLLERMEITFDKMTPGTSYYKMDQDQGYYSVLKFYQEIDPNDPFGAALRGFVEEAKEKIEAVEGILSGKVLRAISAFLNKYADDQPFESEEILLEYDIGRVKLVYDGEPDRRLINRPESANPRSLSDYIPYFMKAKALLDRRGFSDLWYGPMFVGCPKCGGENPLGKKFGVGAHYMIGRDEITVFLEPKRYLVELLIHELGHRYYFKFMDQGDRARFDSFYKEVAAVSEYGGTTTEEDFAEVFSHFVLGRDMTRDQIERFKAFLAKKDRGRFASTFRLPSRHLTAKGKAKKDVGHGGLDEWFSGHGEGKSKGEGEATWGDWVAISPVKKKIETELADGTVKTETVYPGDIVGPCGVSEDPNWKDVTKGGKDPLKCMPRQKAHDMDKSERAELAKAKMKAEKSEGNGKKPVMTPTFQKDKEAASLAERVATRALEAADIPPEKVRELMLKIRKGATSSLTLPQLDAVLRSLGAKVDPIVGFVPSKSRIHNDTLEDAEETLEKVKKFQVPSLPAKPKPGMLYVTKIYPIDTKALYPQVEFDSAVAATGIRIVMPDGKKGEILPTESQIYKPKEIINLGGKSAPKSSVPVYEVERWLGKETDWIARINAFLGMEEHIPAEARTQDRTGSCPVCFQNVKLSARNEIVLHGYQRPGYGFVQGKCPGVGSPPFEISPKGTETYLKNVLEPGVKSLKDQVKLLLSGKVDSIQYKGKLIDKKSPSWDFLLAKKKESAEADLQQAIEDRDAFTNLVQNWKERPLPKEGERLINWFIQGQKSASLRVLARYMEAAGKYDDIDFKPPASVAAEAKKGLEYREKASPSNKGGLTPAEASEQGIGSGVQRAVNLKNRDNVTPETISKMVGFFARHEKNKGVSPENKGEPWNDKGHVAWLLWGGDPGKSWAEKVKAQMDKADEQGKTAARPPVGPKPASPSQISYAKSLIEQGTRGLRGVPAWLSPEDAPTDKQLAEMDSNAISTLIDSLKSRKPFEVERYGGGGYKVTRKASPERVADRFLMGR